MSILWLAPCHLGVKNAPSLAPSSFDMDFLHQCAIWRLWSHSTRPKNIFWKKEDFSFLYQFNFFKNRLFLARHTLHGWTLSNIKVSYTLSLKYAWNMKWLLKYNPNRSSKYHINETSSTYAHQLFHEPCPFSKPPWRPWILQSKYSKCFAHLCAWLGLCYLWWV